MGVRNYLIEGVSGVGKTSVCRELVKRGYRAIDGDTELAYQGDPVTGDPTDVPSHWHHLWRVDTVRAVAADGTERITFFCGGSRNLSQFIDVFDGVFVLEVDLATLHRRLGQRSDEFGSRPDERALIGDLHRSGADTPQHGIRIDATEPLHLVVDEIVRLAVSIDERLRPSVTATDRLPRPTAT